MQPDIPRKPPGRRLVNRLTLRSKRVITLCSGLALLALGLYVMANAVTMRIEPNAIAARWVLMTLYSIIIILVAVYIFGQSTRFQVLIDINNKMRKQERELTKLIRKVNKKEGKKGES